MASPSICFIGLGSMGLPMARLLAKAGYPLSVYNRTPGKAAALAAEGVKIETAAAAAVQPGGVVITMLANDAALMQVMYDGRVLDVLGKGGLHISMSTVSPDTSRRLAEAHAAKGSLFLSAPVFGRPEAAAAKKLWIVKSGAVEAGARAAPYLEAMSQGVYDFGTDPGAANVVKLSGNFMILSAIETLAEAFALGEKNGVDRKALSSFFAETIFNCPIYQNYGRILAERAYEPPGFTMALGMKDMRLVRETAEDSQVPMPVADVLNGNLMSGLAKGREGMDWTAIELASAEAAGLK